MTDQELVALATDAAVTEARRRGWVGPDEELPPGDESPTAASLLVAMIGRRYLADLRGVPVPPPDVDEFIAECKARRRAEAELRVRG